MAKVASSILAADFASMGRDVGRLEEWGASMVHCDVMDGVFVPNLSIGPQLVKAIRPYTRLPLDVHLMIVQPERHIGLFTKAGADRITIHQEATPHLHRALALIREHGAKTGVALNPSTNIATIENVLDMLDMVLIMTVDPGYGGQAFIPAMYEKVAALKRMIVGSGYQIDIQVDGGVGPDNAAALVRAGVDVLVAGTSVFGADDPEAAIRLMGAAK